MSTEHQPTAERNERHQAEVEALARQYEKANEQARPSPEAAAEHQENRANEAREIINRDEPKPEPAEQEQPAPKPTFAARLDHVFNYSDTMRSVQQHLSPASRSFSKVIHAPAVEKTSEALENTVMRPSVVAGATWTALLVGLIFYLVARHYGYTLSGSEMVLSLVGGAVLGVILEWVARMFRRHP